MQSLIRRHDSKLTVLEIADVSQNRDFQRIDKKEFRYKGFMYDIVHELKTRDKTVFICIHDAKESKLFSGLKRASQNKAHLSIWNHLNMVFYSEQPFDLEPELSGNLLFPKIEISAKSSILKTWSPPPEDS
jgi:hypothetical protein